MRRPAAAVLGTLAGAVLMIGAKLGTAPTSSPATIADAPVDPAFDGSDDPRRTESPAGSAPASIAPPQPGAGPSDGPTAGPSTTTTQAIPPPTGGLDNGAFTGPAVTHKYGTLQVTIVVGSGAISDVRWTYTTHLQLSKSINAEALPKLRTQTLAVQTARVDTVSGATYTSDAYRTSLQAAIDKAK